MIILDATIVNVALPTIQEDLGFSQNDLAWVVNGYLIAFGGLLVLSGRIGDLIGQRRIVLIGLGMFTAASHPPAIAMRDLRQSARDCTKCRLCLQAEVALHTARLGAPSAGEVGARAYHSRGITRARSD